MEPTPKRSPAKKIEPNESLGMAYDLLKLNEQTREAIVQELDRCKQFEHELTAARDIKYNEEIKDQITHNPLVFFAPKLEIEQRQLEYVKKQNDIKPGEIEGIENNIKILEEIVADLRENGHTPRATPAASPAIPTRPMPGMPQRPPIIPPAPRVAPTRPPAPPLIRPPRRPGFVKRNLRKIVLATGIVAAVGSGYEVGRKAEWWGTETGISGPVTSGDQRSKEEKEEDSPVAMKVASKIGLENISRSLSGIVKEKHLDKIADAIINGSERKASPSGVENNPGNIKYFRLPEENSI